MKFFFIFLSFIIKVTRLATWCCIFIVLLGIAAPYFENIRSFHYFEVLLNINAWMISLIKSVIPTKLNHFDASSIIGIVLLMIISRILTNMEDRLNSARRNYKLHHYHAPFPRQDTAPVVQSHKSAPMQTPTYDVQKLAPGRERKELLKDFASIKKELEKIGRDLSFLAIDVVDSTNMKLGEDPVLVESDFTQYHDFILAQFKENGFIKASWTPDGVMACFNTTEQAVNAAKNILVNCRSKIEMSPFGQFRNVTFVTSIPSLNIPGVWGQSPHFK